MRRNNRLEMEENTIIFERNMYERMLRWKSKRNSSSALPIQSAKWIGKFTLAEVFVRNEYKSYLLIDFTSCPQEEHDLYKDVSILHLATIVCLDAIWKYKKDGLSTCFNLSYSHFLNDVVLWLTQS